MTNDLPKIQRLARVAQAFTPGAPVDDLELFAGRINQAQDVVNAAVQKGQHVALYGERGVGKTSLANIVPFLFRAPDLPNFQPAKVNCHTEDTFDGLWRKVFRELGINAQEETLDPEDIRYTLEDLDPPALIVVDELDRLDDALALTLLADTVKALSDHVSPSTLLLVGVARRVDDLIGEHESVARALVKVHMPRMSLPELREILEKGFAKAELTAEPIAVEQIVRLSRGLPHFTHLLALHAGQRTVVNDRDHVTMKDVVASLTDAVEKHIVEADYIKATHSPHSDNLYPHVLLACALAPQDQFGYFTPGAVRNPLEIITGRRIDIPQFARHLKQFLSVERGSVLLREGSPRRYVYRFRDPILQTYVILNGIARGSLSDDQLAKLEVGAPPTPDETIEPEQLF